MHEIEELEKAWKRYRFKKRMPWAVGSIISLTLIGSFSYYFLYRNNKKPSSPSHQTRHVISTPHAVKEVQNTVSEPHASVNRKIKPEKETVEKLSSGRQILPKQKPETKSGLVVLNPDIAFLSHIAKSTQTATSSIVHRQSPIKPIKEEKLFQSQPKKVQKKDSSKHTDPLKSEKKPSSLQLVSTRTNNTLQHIINRFQRTRDPKLALYIAQSFYNKRAYEEAVRWSIMANSIDPSNEESWIVYAKAKVRLNRKEEAIKALKIYLNQYVSKKVQTYLKYLESMP